MTGLPAITVKLDDGTGTFPIDVTSRTEGDVTVSSYGRTDEFSTAQAATLDLTLDNTDGGLTVGTGFGFGLGGFGLGGFGGSGGGMLAPGQRIRFIETVGATTRNRFTGRIVSAPLGWPGGSQAFSTIEVTAVDPLADAARKTLRSMLEQEILLNSPFSLYTLGEAEGSTAAGDTSGNQQPPLTPEQPTTYAFGADMGAGVTGVRFTGLGLLVDKRGLICETGTFSGTSVSATFLVIAGAPGPDETVSPFRGWFPLVLPSVGASAVQIDSAGKVRWGGATSPASVTDGALHVVTVQAGGGGTSDIWIDGVKVASAAVTSISWSNTSHYQVEGNPILGAVSTIGQVAFGPRASDAAVTAIHRAVSGSETTAARLARLASYGGFTTSTTAGMSGQLMGAQATSGQSLADALQTVAEAEGGVLYANGSGTIVLQGNGYRAMKTTADLTLTNDELSIDTTVDNDMSQVINIVTVTRTGGATQVVSDAASIDANDEYPSSLDLPVATDADALLRAQWLVAKHSDPAPRLPSATLDPQKSALAEQILQRDIGDRLALTPMPSQMWPGAGDVTIEGWVETVSETSWTLTVNLLPWSLFQSGIYDNAGSLYGTAVYA